MELQELVTLAKECKGAGNWTSASLIRVGGVLAGKINTIANMSGTEKLRLVQRVLLQVLAETENKEVAEPNLSKEDIQKIHDRYDILENTVNDVLPASLELAIKAARGGLDLKKIKPSMWVQMCSCFANAVVQQLASHNLISESHAIQARQLLVKAEEKAKEVAKAKDSEMEAQEAKKEAPPKELSESVSSEEIKPTVSETPVVVSQETSP